MRIITAVYEESQKPYKQMAVNLIDSAEKLGYQGKVYSLKENPAAMVEDNYYFLNCSFKPYIIRSAMAEFNEDIAWLDADCLIQDRIDEALEGCDVAVTLRRMEARNGLFNPLYDGYLNAGVAFFKCNDKAKEFINYWVAELPGCLRQTDQEALSRVVIKATDFNTYNVIVELQGIKIKIMRTDDYNFFHFPEEHNKAKILHFKGIHDPAMQVMYDKILSDLTL